MQGLWIYAVGMYKWTLEEGWRLAGFNSFYEDKNAAIDKVKWLNEEIKKVNIPEQAEKYRANFQKVMYFKGKLKGGKYSDRCTVCAAELEAGVPLTGPEKNQEILMGCKSKVRSYLHKFKDKKTDKEKTVIKKKSGCFGRK